MAMSRQPVSPNAGGSHGAIPLYRRAVGIGGAGGAAIPHADAVLFFAADAKKFAGGRPAVQDTTIAEYFYLPDPCPALRLQSNEPILRVSRDSGVVVTAFKKAERRGGFILRLLNLQEKPAEAAVEADGLQSVTSLSEREDTPLLQTRLSLRKKELLTLRIRRGSR